MNFVNKNKFLRKRNLFWNIFVTLFDSIVNYEASGCTKVSLFVNQIKIMLFHFAISIDKKDG